MLHCKVADRAEKLDEIEKMRQRIAKVEAASTEEAGGEVARKSRLKAMQLRLERLKILADINDPLVKRKFEDGQGLSIISPFDRHEHGSVLTR